MPLQSASRLAAIAWSDDAPVIVDQRRLPDALVEWRLRTVDEVVDAIRTLAVRGAPAIGIAGAYGVALGLRTAALADAPAARAEALRLADRVGNARPTAVNLRWAVERVAGAVAAAPDDIDAIRHAALAEARAIHAEDVAACAAIAAAGTAYLEGPRRILTHCNTGRLATGGDGTALGIVYALHAAGRLDGVIATEARPLLQGGRLTAWELAQAGIPARLVVDGAAGAAMATGQVDAVIVGCDRVAANGDTANKIGTYALAVLARHHGIPFLVAGPRSTFDARLPDGAAIVVEERDGDEVRALGGRRVAPEAIDVWNPAFDVTPAALITAFVTDGGVLEPPFGPAIALLVGR